MSFVIRFLLTAFLFLLPAGLQGCAGNAGDPSPATEAKQHAEEQVFTGTMAVGWSKEECKP